MKNNNQSQYSFRGVRSSKFRHIFGAAARRDRSYDSLKITHSAHDGNFCAANPKFVAVVMEVAGGGAFVVCPIEKTGRVDSSNRVAGHSGPVTDIKWSPFNDNVIASGSDDRTVKVWHIPDGGLTGSLTEWLVDLRGHKRRVSYIDWHPTAENVLISAGLDHLIIVWNINKGEVVHVIDCHQEHIYSMSLNRDGSLLATTCKDKKLRIIEPRTGCVLQEGQCHEGAKACKVQYLGDTGRLLTTGFSKYSDRQYAVWREDQLDEPLRLETIDSSSGVLYPFYDPDTKVLFLAGKGDGNIRYYEMVNEPPWCHYLNQYISGSPQRGLGVLTKRACDTKRCEIFRFFKLHATKDLCEPLSMIVPRKSDQFQEDIYPDTAAPTPALTAEEWISGVDKPPVLMSLRAVGVPASIAVQTHKPVSVNKAQNRLKPGDRNTDMKFAFISTVPRPDYRPQQDEPPTTATTTDDGRGSSVASSDEHTDDADDVVPHDSVVGRRNRPSQGRLDESLKSPTRIQQLQQKWNTQESAPASGPEPSCNQEQHRTSPLKSWNGTAAPQEPAEVRHNAAPVKAEPTHRADIEMRRRYAEQAEEIKQLKNMLNIKEQRIRELEDQLDDVMKKSNESTA